MTPLAPGRWAWALPVFGLLLLGLGAPDRAAYCQCSCLDGVDAMTENNWVLAARLFDDCIQASAECARNPGVLQNLAECVYNAGRTSQRAEAEAAVRRAIALGAGARAHTLLGRLLIWKLQSIRDDNGTLRDRVDLLREAERSFRQGGDEDEAESAVRRAGELTARLNQYCNSRLSTVTQALANPTSSLDDLGKADGLLSEVAAIDPGRLGLAGHREKIAVTWRARVESLRSRLPVSTQVRDWDALLQAADELWRNGIRDGGIQQAQVLARARVARRNDLLEHVPNAERSKHYPWLVDAYKWLADSANAQDRADYRSKLGSVYDKWTYLYISNGDCAAAEGIAAKAAADGFTDFKSLKTQLYFFYCKHRRLVIGAPLVVLLLLVVMAIFLSVRKRHRKSKGDIDKARSYLKRGRYLDAFTSLMAAWRGSEGVRGAETQALLADSVAGMNFKGLSRTNQALVKGFLDEMLSDVKSPELRVRLTWYRALCHLPEADKGWKRAGEYLERIAASDSLTDGLPWLAAHFLARLLGIGKEVAESEAPPDWSAGSRIPDFKVPTLSAKDRHMVAKSLARELEVMVARFPSRLSELEDLVAIADEEDLARIWPSWSLGLALAQASRKPWEECRALVKPALMRLDDLHSDPDFLKGLETWGALATTQQVALDPLFEVPALVRYCADRQDRTEESRTSVNRAIQELAAMADPDRRIQLLEQLPRLPEVVDLLGTCYLKRQKPLPSERPVLAECLAREFREDLFLHYLQVVCVDTGLEDVARQVEGWGGRLPRLDNLEACIEELIEASAGDGASVAGGTATEAREKQ